MLVKILFILLFILSTKKHVLNLATQILSTLQAPIESLRVGLRARKSRPSLLNVREIAYRHEILRFVCEI